MNKQILQIQLKLLRIPTGGRLTSWLFSQRGRRVKLGTTENKSRLQQGAGFEPGTSRFQIQRPKPLGHAASVLSELLSKRPACRV